MCVLSLSARAASLFHHPQSVATHARVTFRLRSSAPEEHIAEKLLAFSPEIHRRRCHRAANHTRARSRRLLHANLFTEKSAPSKSSSSRLNATLNQCARTHTQTAFAIKTRNVRRRWRWRWTLALLTNFDTLYRKLYFFIGLF